jgi:ATP adenylyltransferase
MERIFAPWRIEYIEEKKPVGCIFCKSSIRSDEYLLQEDKAAYVMLNKYPYVSGHILIVPARHIGNLEDLSPEESKEMFILLDRSVRVLREAMKPEGFNIGMNLGKSAGAGVVEHLHIHVIPRWEGDTNFMSVVNDIRVIPEDLCRTAAKLVPLFNTK